MFVIKKLENAEIGIIFRREESEYHNERRWRTAPCWFRSADTIRSGEFTIPDDAPLPPKVIDYDLTDSFSAAEDDIPF